MARQTKAAKAIDNAVTAAYNKHFNCVQVNMMDLTKIMNVGRDAAKAAIAHDGTISLLEVRGIIDDAMAAAVPQFRQDR